MPAASVPCGAGAAAAAVVMGGGAAAVVVVVVVIVAVVVVAVAAVVVVVAVIVAAIVVAAALGVIVAAAVVVVDVVVVVGSDINVNAIRPTCRLHWFLQHILHSKCRKHECGRYFLHHIEACSHKYGVPPRSKRTSFVTYKGTSMLVQPDPKPQDLCEPFLSRL